MIYRKLQFEPTEGLAWVEVREKDTVLDRYTVEGDNVVHFDEDGKTILTETWKRHNETLGHDAALNEIGLLNACACLDSLMRLSPENLEYIQKVIEAELDNRGSQH